MIYYNQINTFNVQTISKPSRERFDNDSSYNINPHAVDQQAMVLELPIIQNNLIINQPNSPLQFPANALINNPSTAILPSVQSTCVYFDQSAHVAQLHSLDSQNATQNTNVESKNLQNRKRVKRPYNNVCFIQYIYIMIQLYSS